MQALKMIPKVLENIQDVHRNSGQDTVLNQYKKNIKLFIKQVSMQVSSIIEKYEAVIKQLKIQNQTLKKTVKDQSIHYLPLQSPVKKYSPPKQFIKSSKMRSTNLDLMQTAKSNIFTPFASQYEQPKLSKILSKYRKSYQDDGNFPMELINPQPSDEIGKSRFQVKSNKKKQREQQLVCFLSSGRKNLYHTTQRFLQSIGKGKRYESQDNKNQNEVNNNSESSNSKNKDDSQMNKSLGNICNSLDNSYVAKRARSSKKKRSSQIQEEAKRKIKQQQELAKMLKDKGIKNILSRLRENVQNSATKPVEMIRSSKLISCGGGGSPVSPKKSSNKSGIRNEQQQNSTLKKRSSKVMINPVPVDIVKKSMVSSRQGNSSPPSPLSPQKRPQSILKTSNILGRSLSGISAIQFD